MKKILLIVLIEIVFLFAAKSQDLKYGLRFGINRSNVEFVGLQLVVSAIMMD